MSKGVFLANIETTPDVNARFGVVVPESCSRPIDIDDGTGDRKEGAGNSQIC